MMYWKYLGDNTRRMSARSLQWRCSLLECNREWGGHKSHSANHQRTQRTGHRKSGARARLGPGESNPYAQNECMWNILLYKIDTDPVTLYIFVYIYSWLLVCREKELEILEYIGETGDYHRPCVLLILLTLLPKCWNSLGLGGNVGSCRVGHSVPPNCLYDLLCAVSSNPLPLQK